MCWCNNSKWWVLEWSFLTSTEYLMKCGIIVWWNLARAVAEQAQNAQGDSKTSASYLSRYVRVNINLLIIYTMFSMIEQIQWFQPFERFLDFSGKDINPLGRNSVRFPDLSNILMAFANNSLGFCLKLNIWNIKHCYYVESTCWIL